MRWRPPFLAGWPARLWAAKRRRPPLKPCGQNAGGRPESITSDGNAGNKDRCQRAGPRAQRDGSRPEGGSTAAPMATTPAPAQNRKRARRARKGASGCCSDGLTAPPRGPACGRPHSPWPHMRAREGSTGCRSTTVCKIQLPRSRGASRRLQQSPQVAGRTGRSAPRRRRPRNHTCSRKSVPLPAQQKTNRCAGRSGACASNNAMTREAAVVPVGPLWIDEISLGRESTDCLHDSAMWPEPTIVGRCE